MNAEAHNNPAHGDWPAHPGSDVGWSWKKTIVLIGLAFAAHLALLFVFAAKKSPAPRAPTNVPHFEIAANDPVLVALDDPTLFAVPHVEDIAPSVWRTLPEIVLPPTTLIEPSPFLLPRTETLGTRFSEFMATNRFAKTQLDLKPEPRFSSPIVPVVSVLPTNSTLRATGDLANRPRIGSVNLPILPYNDVIAPSRVQVLVDPGGRVYSEVLLDSSGYDKADTIALDVARSLRFAPADQITLGDIVFDWNTVPETAGNTNSPAAQ